MQLTNVQVVEVLLEYILLVKEFNLNKKVKLKIYDKLVFRYIFKMTLDWTTKYSYLLKYYHFLLFFKLSVLSQPFF